MSAVKSLLPNDFTVMLNFRSAFIFFLLGITFSRPAVAYIDPINGAMLLQLILSGVGGAVFFFRRVIGNFLRRMKTRFTRKIK